MFGKMVVYRPTSAALAAHKARGGAQLPREIHVLADGGVVACYDGLGDVHFAAIDGVFDKHGLSRTELEQIP